MKVQMTKTTLGSDRNKNGVAMPVQNYESGETYAVGCELAKAFLHMGVAVEVTTMTNDEAEREVDSGEATIPTDAIVAPENKDAGAAPENKSKKKKSKKTKG
jgi:hypothetical protein